MPKAFAPAERELFLKMLDLLATTTNGATAVLRFLADRRLTWRDIIIAAHDPLPLPPARSGVAYVADSDVHMTIERCLAQNEFLSPDEEECLNDLAGRKNFDSKQKGLVAGIATRLGVMEAA